MSTSRPPPPPDLPPEIADFVRRTRRSSDPRAALVRPLAEGRRDAVADRFLASLVPSEAAHDSRSSASAPAATDDAHAPTSPPGPANDARDSPSLPVAPAASPGRPLARVISMYSKRRAAAAWATLLAAAAAVLLLPRLWVTAPGATWTVHGEQPSRGDAPAPQRRVAVRPDTVLRIAITLDRPADEVKVRLVVARGATAATAPATRRVLDGATLGLEQTASEMLGPQADGEAELVLVAAAELPSEADAIEVALGKKSVRGWAVLRQPVLFEGWQKTGRLDRPGAAGEVVDVAGCAAFLADGTCELGARRTVIVWGPGRPAVYLDGAPAQGTTRTAGHGTRHDVAVPEGAHALAIEVGDRRLSLSLRDTAGDARIEAAAAALREGRLDAAEAAVRAPEDFPDPTARIAAARIAAKIRRRRAAAGTDTFTGAQAARLAVADEARAAGRVSEATDDRLAVVYSYLIDTRDVDRARALLDACEADAAHTAETRTLWEYSNGLWAREIGDLGTALDDLERARDRASRMGLDGLTAAVAPSLAEVLAELGRSDEALSLLPPIEGRTGCDRAAARSNRGWVRLLAGDVATAADELARALADAGGRCPADEPTIALNLGYAEQARGATQDAARWLGASRSRTRPDDARLRAWQDRMEIQLSLVAEPASALAAAERLALRAEQDGSPELRFEATFGRARALAAQDRPGEAGAAFEQAERALDDWARTVRVGQGREGLSARLDTAPRTWLSFLAARAERSGAAEDEARLSAAAMRALSRWVRTLSPPDEPVPPGAPAAASATPTAATGPSSGELWLLFHPLETDTLGIAWVAERIRHVHIPAAAGDPAAVAAALVAPFREEIGHAERVRLLLHRSFGARPLGAVAIGERVLAEVVALEHGLGLDARPAPARRDGPPRALVVLDPRGDLSGARRSRAAEDLAARGFEVTELRGARATRAAVLDALRAPCPDLLHYEGHGAHRGVDGEDAGLWLEDGELGVRDVRELACAPRHVVLAACDSARPSGLALSHAFVERGAAAVLGASATLDDELAASVMRQLYAAPSGGPGEIELPAALASALRALRAAGGNAAEAAAKLRVVTP